MAAYLAARPEGIRPAEGTRAFALALETGLSQVVVSPYDVVAMVERSTRAAETSTAAEPVASTPVLALSRHERPAIDTPFVAPRDDLEERLATIWQAVLGIERVGVDDNFFSLGGDSILGIQVVARAREAGLSLTSRLLYQHPSVADLAAILQPVKSEPMHDRSAPIPLTPIQRWFFERDLLDSHHFNQSAALETAAGIDSSLVERALAALVEHHEALRFRYTVADGQVQQTLSTARETALAFSVVDLSGLTLDEQQRAILEQVSGLQTCLDLEHGPLVSAAYFDCGPAQAGQLSLVIHHLVVDGVSWRILIEDLQLAYEQLRAGQSVQLPATTLPFADWAHRLQEYARSAQVRDELGYWRDQLARPRVPVPANSAERVSTESQARRVDVSLTVDETHAILRQVPRALRARINAVLLGALARAMAEWTGQSTLVVDLEGHGREPIADDVDLTRSVGWFTTMYPVSLDVTGAASIVDSVRSVRASLQQIPCQGIGYGLLRHLGDETSEAQALRQYPRPEISFNYLGQFDQLLAEPGVFRLSGRAATGANQSPRQVRGHLLDFGGAVIDGQLHLHCTYSEALHDASTMQRLLDAVAANLRLLIAESGSTAPTAREFPLAGLDQQRLASLLGKVGRSAKREDG
ncbi:MAG: hypothetical protein IT305_13080 [Chloroflexi bacterium]|nr:hypothetical protein [Chloroflexota bacterium]